MAETHKYACILKLSTSLSIPLPSIATCSIAQMSYATLTNASTTGLLSQFEGTQDAVYYVPTRPNTPENASIAPRLTLETGSSWSQSGCFGRTIYTPTASPSIATKSPFRRVTSQVNEASSIFTHVPRFDGYGELLPAAEWDMIPNAPPIGMDFEDCSETGYSTPPTPSDSFSLFSPSSDGLSTPENGDMSAAQDYFQSHSASEDLGCSKATFEVPSEESICELSKEILNLEECSCTTVSTAFDSQSRAVLMTSSHRTFPRMIYG